MTTIGTPPLPASCASEESAGHDTTAKARESRLLAGRTWGSLAALTGALLFQLSGCASAPWSNPCMTPRRGLQALLVGELVQPWTRYSDSVSLLPTLSIQCQLEVLRQWAVPFGWAGCARAVATT